MTSPDNYLIIGAALFALGAIGFLTRRNLILMMLSSELMLHGVSLALVAFSAARGDHQGQAFTAFVLTVAASEAGIGLALILTLYRRRKTLDVNIWNSLGEPATRPVERETHPPVTEPRETPRKPTLPRLTPAGHPPMHKVESRKEATGV